MFCEAWGAHLPTKYTLNIILPSLPENYQHVRTAWSLIPTAERTTNNSTKDKSSQQSFHDAQVVLQGTHALWKMIPVEDDDALAVFHVEAALHDMNDEHDPSNPFKPVSTPILEKYVPINYKDALSYPDCNGLSRLQCNGKKGSQGVCRGSRGFALSKILKERCLANFSYGSMSIFLRH